MHILVLIDPETFYPDDPQFERALQEVRSNLEFHVVEALRHLDHQVEVLPFGKDIRQNLRELSEKEPDLVFNLTEHYGGDRQKDMHIASMLELAGIPFTGTGPAGLLLCRDKAICKTILNHHRIKVPQFASVPVGRTKPRRKLCFPLIVKPALMDGSDGISLGSLVSNEDELKERVEHLHNRTNQKVICEEYIEGQEIYVGLLGNKQLTVLPARELRFNSPDDNAPQIATARVKLDDDYRKKWNIEYTFAELSPDMEKKIARISKRIYRLLHMRDYGRIDMRIANDGTVVFLEANPNPDLTLGDELSESAERAGINYQQLIDRIVRLAVNRNGSS